MQLSFLVERPKGQLLKWVGNKYRYANEIAKFFPQDFDTYYEPFVGTGAVLATLQPKKAVASDALEPLIELWKLVQNDPQAVEDYYEKWINEYNQSRKPVYNKIKDNFNNKPNGLDLLLLSRTCYGGVIRFTKQGTLSTPIGPHKPIPPETFSKRLREWADRVKNCEFHFADYKELMQKAGSNDLVYCDPPYKDSQSILYGAQSFELDDLFDEILAAKNRGAKVALSIDGEKKSGMKKIEFKKAEQIFAREVFIDCGHSMLRRFQKNGEKMNGEKVKERLLLTW